MSSRPLQLFIFVLLAATMLLAALRKETTAGLSWSYFFQQSSSVVTKQPRVIRFATFGNAKYNKSRYRILSEANATGWFDHVRAYGPLDLPKDFKEHYSDVLSQRRGGGYWIWKFFVIENELQTMKDGDFFVYVDAGCSVNLEGADRFWEYVTMVEESPYNVLSFQDVHPEQRYTTEYIFRAFNITSNNTKIRSSGQYIATVLVLQKGEHLRKWLDWIETVLDQDIHLITDKYNSVSNQLNPLLKDNRHDQSLFSVSRKVVGSVVIKDETYPPGQLQNPFWASRIKG